MPEMLVSESVDPAHTRLGRALAETASALGPLADLVGTWVSIDGVEVIAVPAVNAGGETFRLIVEPYIETLVVTPIGAPVPNRGGPAGDMFINGVLYDIRIASARTGEPLHVENGMWLYLGEGESPAVARQASIPHGDVILAVGDVTTLAGPPPIGDRSALPVSGPKTQLGYADAYQRVSPTFQASNVVAPLQDLLKNQDVVRTVTMSVSTANGGGISNIPFVVRNANTTAFECVFWIETVRRPNGSEFLQLQYFQQTTIEFLPTFGGPPGSLIVWPHTNTATMIKQ